MLKSSISINIRKKKILALEEDMEKRDLDLLNRIYQDAQIGMQSIDKVLKKSTNENLNKLLRKQFEQYSKFADTCDTIAINSNEEVKDNSMFKKIKQTAMIYFSLWSDKSNEHIIEMMITGTVMGIIDCIKAKKDITAQDENINQLVVEFLKMQEDFYEKLKKQLAKV